MDEDAAAAFAEDGAEGRPHGEDDAPQNYVKSTETADSKYLDTFATNCGTAECSAVPVLTTLTSACFAAISLVFPAKILHLLIRMYKVWKHYRRYCY